MNWNSACPLVTLFCACSFGLSQTNTNLLVVPRTAETSETPYGAGTLRDVGIRNQQVYGSVEFPQQPIVIEQLRFRPDATFGSAFSATIAHIQINLSTTQRNPGALSSVFSENIGADDTIAFDGPLAISSQFTGPVNGPKAFDIIVPLTRPYLYDPAAGNLVIDTRNYSGSTASPVSGQTGPDSASRVIGSTDGATGTIDIGTDAIQISFSPGTNLPPRIVTQPQSLMTGEGSDITFSVGAIGSAPLTYTWRKWGAAIAGATNAALTITNVQVGDAGEYSVVVSNAAGSATSQAAMLTVIRRADHDVSLDFGIANGNPNGVWSYGWQGTLGGVFTLFTHSKYNYDPAGVPIEVWDKPNSVPAIQHNNSTSTAVTDGGQGNFPPETTWFYPGVEGQPENFGVIRFTVPVGRDGIYDLATRARPVWDGSNQRDADFHVLRNGVELFGTNLIGNTFATYTNRVGLAGGDAIDFVIGRGPDNTYVGTGLKIEATLDVVSLTPIAPSISSQPTNQTVLEGSSATFSVRATGTVPLTYQWRQAGAVIMGATNASLTITNVQVGDAGEYSVVVSNAAGSATSQAAMLTVHSAPENAAVVPRTAENTETPYGSGTLRDAGIRSQQVYGSIEFPQQPMLIEQLRFRPDARFGSAFSTTVSNIQINLSTTQRNPGSLSSTFSQNVGADDRVVFQGALSISSQFFGPTNGPKAFDIVVPLEQPYLYDPAGGNLVIDIRNFSGSAASRVSGQTGPDSASRVIGGAAAATGTVDVGADAIQVVFTPATNLAPRIVAQPTSQAVVVGSNVTFSVTVVGSAPLTYYWRFNGVPIAGATSASLAITNVGLSNAGIYSVIVENDAGIAFSSEAVLSIVTEGSLIVPAGLQSREGVGASGSLTEQLRMQEIYGASQFPPGNLNVTEIRLRPSADFATGVFTTAVDNIQINLSTTAKQPNNLSLTFAENTGANDTVVFNGSLSISTQFSGPAGGPKSFDIRVPLQTPFLYNRSAGNLLLDIRNFSGAPFRYVVDSDNAVDQASRIFATSASATQAVAADNGADVLQIVYSITNTAPRLVAVPASPGGFAFQAAGLGNYVIEGSTNLVNWTLVTNVVGASGVVEITDSESATRPLQFYRARTAP